MRPLALVLLATATLATPLAQMDSSVAGRRIGDHHQSRVDLQKGLYLFYDGN